MSGKPSRYTSTGGFGKTHFGDGNESDDGMASVGSNDLDIDFSITESGRTVAHLIANMKEDDTSIMDFSITNSGRTVTGADDDAGQMTKPKPIPPVTAAAAKLSSTHHQSGSVESSGSAFITGIMSNTAKGATSVAHTPPSALGTSYEARHFGKRPRSGSVSGRLRSASDLEDKGIIDRHQKGLLKDLIIAGDEMLQDALDKYDQGDSSKLESMIKSGSLRDRLSTDIDLLGDLDLDFLTFEDMDDKTTPQQQMPDLVVSSCADDGLGDLEFNGDFSADRNTKHRKDSIGHYNLRKESFDVDGRKESFDDQSRLRSNSLAYGVLSNEGQPTESYDHWIDRPPTEGIHIRKTTPTPLPPGTGGLAACLAEYGRSKNEAQTGRTKKTKAQVKAEAAEEKRKERQLRKEQKEREKKEQKERKEKERREKKEQKEREKQQRKERKGAKAKEQETEEEESSVVISGTGRPRSISDPNLKISLDENGLLQVDRPEGWVGAYSPESRKIRIERFMEKRNHRVWTKSVKYDVRKNFADSRLRVKGRFVKKEDELLMRELMSLT